MQIRLWNRIKKQFKVWVRRNKGNNKKTAWYKTEKIKRTGVRYVAEIAPLKETLKKSEAKVHFVQEGRRSSQCNNGSLLCLTAKIGRELSKPYFRSILNNWFACSHASQISMYHRLHHWEDLLVTQQLYLVLHWWVALTLIPGVPQLWCLPITF